MDAESLPSNTSSDPGRELLLKDEVFAVVGCAFEVINVLGHGGKEKIYENSLCVEFKRREISFEQQRSFPAIYKGEHVGTLIPDLITHGSVVVETKVIPRIGDLERGQILNYLKITGLRVGLILNFSKPTLEWQRLIL